MICWVVFLGIIIAYISLIIFSKKLYKIYKFTLGFFLKALNFSKLVFKAVKLIFLNLHVIFKYLIYSILALTILIIIINVVEFLIILLKNLIIGLKESFSNSTREGRLYYISLYIVLAYVFINRKEISLKIYKYIEVFKNKYFYSKNKENIEKYKNVILFLCVYASICIVGLSFYHLNGNAWSEKNKSDIINIFIWATYLIAPVVAIWVYSDWKDPYTLNKKIDLIHELEDQILNLEVAARDLDKLTQDYINNRIKNYYELQFKRNEFTRKTANLDILSRRLELTPELKALSKDVSNLNYSFVNYSSFSRDLISILKNNEIEDWSSYENSLETDERMNNLFINHDDREDYLYSCYRGIYEIQKDLIKIMDDYSFKQK